MSIKQVVEEINKVVADMVANEEFELVEPVDVDEEEDEEELSCECCESCGMNYEPDDVMITDAGPICFNCLLITANVVFG